MTTASTENHEFQAEVQQLLNIVIHSLYTDREIFVRELVSNAADALEKLRHIQLSEKEIFDDSLDLEINITSDDNVGTITIQDFGLGMTREELVENLGTIAHSGSKAFLQALKEGAEVNENLIGQFGVGFYSAFMVAEEVQVYTHSWNKDAEHLVWSSTGAGSYSIETTEGQRRGCKIVVKLKEDAKDFAKADRIKSILKQYSSFVNFPINVNGERINTIDAIWLRNKKDIKDEEYNEFYKFQANAFDEPLTRMHFSADAPLAINSLLFVPSTNHESFGFGRMEAGVGLYCRKILIDAKPDKLLPEWLRFLRGVVDSADLPLNISRESMQDHALIQKLNRVITKRFLKQLEDDAKKRPDTFEKVYNTFHMYLKEGVTSDYTHREQLSKLLRYESSVTEEGKTTSLADYVSRKKEEQKEIYYIHGPDRKTIENGPYLEGFKSRGLEVLYLFEPIDEFVMSNLGEFDGNKLVSCDQNEIELDDVPNNQEGSLSEEETTTICEWLKETLGDKVTEVGKSKRLSQNPAIVLNTDKMMTPSMRQMMKSMQQGIDKDPDVKLEINPGHTLIKNLSALKDANPDSAKMVAEQIFDAAMIAAGFLENPRSIVDRTYQLLEKFSENKASS